MAKVEMKTERGQVFVRAFRAKACPHSVDDKPLMLKITTMFLYANK
jgi:hypothetical protein